MNLHLQLRLQQQQLSQSEVDRCQQNTHICTLQQAKATLQGQSERALLSLVHHMGHRSQVKDQSINGQEQELKLDKKAVEGLQHWGHLSRWLCLHGILLTWVTTPTLKTSGIKNPFQINLLKIKNKESVQVREKKVQTPPGDLFRKFQREKQKGVWL